MQQFLVFSLASWSLGCQILCVCVEVHRKWIDGDKQFMTHHHQEKKRGGRRNQGKQESQIKNKKQNLWKYISCQIFIARHHEFRYPETISLAIADNENGQMKHSTIEKCENKLYFGDPQLKYLVSKYSLLVYKSRDPWSIHTHQFDM